MWEILSSETYEVMNTHYIMVEKYDIIRSFGRPRHKWQNDMKTALGSAYFLVRMMEGIQMTRHVEFRVFNIQSGPKVTLQLFSHKHEF
jgi:hypothetical protein